MTDRPPPSPVGEQQHSEPGDRLREALDACTELAMALAAQGLKLGAVTKDRDELRELRDDLAGAEAELVSAQQDLAIQRREVAIRAEALQLAEAEIAKLRRLLAVRDDQIHQLRQDLGDEYEAQLPNPPEN